MFHPFNCSIAECYGLNTDVSKVLRICSRFLKHDLGKTLMPDIDVLKSRGICSSQIKKALVSFPIIFSA